MFLLPTSIESHGASQNKKSSIQLDHQGNADAFQLSHISSLLSWAKKCWSKWLTTQCRGGACESQTFSLLCSYHVGSWCTMVFYRQRGNTFSKIAASLASATLYMSSLVSTTLFKVQKCEEYCTSICVSTNSSPFTADKGKLRSHLIFFSFCETSVGNVHK